MENSSINQDKAVCEKPFDSPSFLFYCTPVFVFFIFDFLNFFLAGAD